MERAEIIKLSKRNISLENLEKAKKILENDYEISYGSYSNIELKKAISEKKPVIIEKHLLVGYDPDNKFLDDTEEKVSIERMVKAIIVEQEKAPISDETHPLQKLGDLFAIVNKNELAWNDKNNLDQFYNILGSLRVGEIFLPKHSAIFNFVNPTEDIKRKKIVSMLDGININVYHTENFIDNCIHEIGHLFWRTSLLWEEKKKFYELFKRLKASAIYQFEWERNTEEEVFCTVYKWYVKSMLINKSFYNILEYEEPEGLKLLQSIFDRIASDKLKNDVFDMYKDVIIEYVNPKYDTRTARFIIKKESFNDIKDIELPRNILNDIQRYENGIEYVNLTKAISVPVKNNKINFEEIYKKRIK